MNHAFPNTQNRWIATYKANAIGLFSPEQMCRSGGTAEKWGSYWGR